MKSILECADCARLLPKIELDQLAEPAEKLPPEVDRLVQVVRVRSEDGAYSANTTRLLRCPACGTHYYYNRFWDEGTHFMDPKSDDVSLRRYTPPAALDFLERLAAETPDSLPPALGQLSRAFLGDGSVSPPRLEGDEAPDQQQAARAELDSLRARYPALVAELADALQAGGLDWPLKIYAVETLVFHHGARGEWEALRARLLEDADREVRVMGARLLTGLIADDLPSLDKLHAPRPARARLERAARRRERLAELADVMLQEALAGHGLIHEYQSGFARSEYVEHDLRRSALYGLVVAAGRDVDLTPAVPALFGLLEREAALISHVCWVLRVLAEKRKWAGRAIRAGLRRLPAELQAHPEVAQLSERVNLA